MKKLFTLVLSVSMILGIAPIINAENATLNTLDVVFMIEPNEATCTSQASFTLSDGVKTYETSANISEYDSTVTAHFNVDNFYTGKDFNFKVVSGLSNIKYYDGSFKTGDILNLWTYTDEKTFAPNSTFIMSATPTEYKKVDLYNDFSPIQSENAPRYINGILYAQANTLSNSVNVSNIEYLPYEGKLRFYVYDKCVEMTIGTTEVSCFGSTAYIDASPILINGFPFIPVKSFCNIFECDYLTQNEGAYINCNVSDSRLVEREITARNRAQFVNQSGVASRTNYLIWVSKSEYKLRVYTGSEGNWVPVNEFLVGIGKESTPTCTGQYEYYQYQSIWPYSGYYVGPVMRFNGGYAIHSTLQRYNGTPYDDRVGQKVSHGCVRVQKDNINWLVNTIPLYTRVFITP